MIARTTVKTYGGINKEVNKLAIFAETDQFGHVFYKIEGQNNSDLHAIKFVYDMDKAIEGFTELVRTVLTDQTEKLENNDIKNTCNP